MKKMVLYVFVIALLSGCQHNQKMTPEQVFNTYLSDWKQGQYDQMYTCLSTNAKSKITREEFIKRYSSIAQGIEMQNFDVKQVAAPQEQASFNASKATYTYHASLSTNAGSIEFNHQVSIVKDNSANGWGIEWDPSLIFPAMKDGDKVVVQTLKAPRGEILDRNGKGLAINGDVTILGLVADQLGADGDKTIQTVAKYFGVTADDVIGKLHASWVKPGNFVPIGPIDSKGLQTFQNVEGVSLQQKKVRQYPLGEAAAHLTGYVQGISADELNKLNNQGYHSDDVIGKSGLEQLFEKTLRGKDGGKIIITDANGNVRSKLAEKAAVPGGDITTTIDSDLQRAIYEQYQKDAGAATAIQPQSGEILALVSSPAFDPNLFVTGLSTQQWNEWKSDSKNPLLNRFTKLYAPGSIFKLITAAVGLNANISSPAKIRHIQGLHWTKDASWGNYYVTRDRDVPDENLRDAVVNSDNIFFAQEALDMGKDTFYNGAYKFGFGDTLPIPYPFPVSSLANQGINSDIQLADSAYGQGEVQMSPLHVALAYTAFLNKGDVISPILIKADMPQNGSFWKQGVIRPEIAELVRQDLVEAVRDPNGFAHGAYIPGMNIAGKTGTAEMKRKKGEDGQENGWFTVFDADHPQLLLTMMIEDVKNRGGSGYVVGKAKKIFLRCGDKVGK